MSEPQTKDSAEEWNWEQESWLWEYLFKQHDYIIQEFFTAIIGIGALFFAFGSLQAVPYVQLSIAFIGLGASAIMWMHAYGSHLQADAIEEQIRAKKSKVIHQYDNIQEWRFKTRIRRITYQPVTRLMTYFCALVTMVWLLIILSRFLVIGTVVISLWFYVAVVVVCVSAVGFRLVYERKSDITKERSKTN